MRSSPHQENLQRLIDRAEIEDVMRRYARGVDRGDWEAVRSTYHPDARDEHGEYQGGVDGLIDWLRKRFAGVDNSMHLLGNCLIEFAAPDLALVETYFVSRRLRAPSPEESRTLGPGDAMAREVWGRYVDRFELREGEWRVADRTVVLEASSTGPALGGVRARIGTWGRRDAGDRIFELRALLFREH